MFYRIVPLSAGFMLTSIMGFLVTIFYMYPHIEESTYSGSVWLNSLAFSFMLFFILMFIASLISMTYAPLDAEVHIHEKKNKKIKG